MTHQPGPERLSDDDLSAMLTAARFGVLATVRRSGHPHLASMIFHWDPEEWLVRFTTRSGRSKVGHLRRDPRATLHVQGPDVMSYAVAQGRGEVSSPTTAPGDAIGRELLLVAGDLVPPEETEDFLRLQVAEERVVLRLHVERLYGARLPPA